MYMNLKPNQHKRISFNTTTVTSLGFIGPLENFSCPLKFSSPPNFNSLLRSPPNYFGLKFLGLPLKLGGRAATMLNLLQLLLAVFLLVVFWSEISRSPPKTGGEGCYHTKSFATVIGSFPASRIFL